MPKSDLTGIVAEDGKAILFVTAVISISAFIGALVLWFLNTSLWWGISLLALGYVAAFAVELNISFHGVYNRLVGPSLTSFVGSQVLVAFLVALALRNDSSSAAAIAVFGGFIVALMAALEYASVSGRNVLRWIREMRPSGDIGLASVSGVVGVEILKAFKPETLERRIQVEIEHGIDSESDVYITERKDSKLGFNEVAVGPLQVFYRVEAGAAEVVFFVRDGQVMRFEKAEKEADALRFAFRQVLHFDLLPNEDAKRVESDLSAACSQFARPLMTGAVRKLVAEGIRKHKADIALAGFLVVIGVAAVFIVYYWNNFASALSDTKNAIALTSLAALVVILGSLASQINKVLGRLRGKGTKK